MWQLKVKATENHPLIPWEEPIHQTLHQKVWYSQVYTEAQQGINLTITLNSFVFTEESRKGSNVYSFKQNT